MALKTVLPLLASATLALASAINTSLLKRQSSLPIEQCPGYAASNIQTIGGQVMSADLSLAGTACNTYGTDLDSLVLQVEYINGKFAHQSSHASICSILNLFTCQFVLSSIHSPINLLVHQFTPPLIHPLTNPFTRQSIHTPTNISSRHTTRQNLRFFRTSVSSTNISPSPTSQRRDTKWKPCIFNDGISILFRCHTEKHGRSLVQHIRL